MKTANKQIDNLNRKEPFRMPIVWFSAFVCLMLFQTSYMRLGTITAVAAIFLSIVAVFMSKSIGGKTMVPARSLLIALFMIFTALYAVLKGTTPSYLIRYCAQIVLFVVLSLLELNERENEILKWVFSVSSAVYAVLSVVSTFLYGRSGYFHESVRLFGTYIDPNYLTIPFVVACVIMFDRLLNGPNRLPALILLVVNFTAIVVAASRGSILCLVAAITFVLIFFITNKKQSFGKVLSMIFLISVLIAVSIILINKQFSGQVDRILDMDFNDGNGRIEIWSKGLAAFRRSPILGNGFGYMQMQYGTLAHNTFIQLLAESGLVGTGVFIVFMIMMFRKAIGYSRLFFVIMLSASIQFMFLDVIDNRTLWIVFIWIAMLPEKKKKKNAVPVPVNVRSVTAPPQNGDAVSMPPEKIGKPEQTEQTELKKQPETPEQTLPADAGAAREKETPDPAEADIQAKETAI